MSTSSSRRRAGRQHAVEHEALTEIANEAEARLAAKRAARAEAREIRMREMERQQLEDQEKERLKNTNSENKKDLSLVSSYASRRSNDGTIDDLKRELSELQEKYVKTMTHNAQLDNDKQTLSFRLALLTDDFDDLTEVNTELRRQLKDKTRDFEHKKKAHELLEATAAKLEEQLKQRDTLIQEHGLIFVTDDVSSDEEDEDKTDGKKKEEKERKCALVSQKAIGVLQNYSGTLDDRLVRLDEENKALEKLVKKLKRDLDEEKERRSITDRFKSHSPTPNRFNNGGGNGEANEVDLNNHSELKRQLKDYKSKVNKAHQEVANLEGTVARLEAQVKRFKTSAENSERSEEELRNEKRKLQKELREAENARNELEVERNHLLKRLERSKGLKVK